MAQEQLKIVYDEASIQARVKELAAEIDAVYAGQPLAVVCVLKGAFMFFTDLVRCMERDVELDFVRLASYGMAKENTPNISFTKDVEISLRDKHVLVVEDVIDSGYSMDFLMRQLAARGALSLRLAVMVDKRERRKVPVHADFVGFALPAGFIVGYGLDCAEQYRTLPAIYELCEAE